MNWDVILTPISTTTTHRLGTPGLLLQLGAQVERALGGKWNGGRVPGEHVTQE